MVCIFVNGTHLHIPRNEIFCTWATAIYLLWSALFCEYPTKFYIHLNWYIDNKTWNKFQILKLNLFELFWPKLKASYNKRLQHLKCGYLLIGLVYLSFNLCLKEASVFKFSYNFYIFSSFFRSFILVSFLFSISSCFILPPKFFQLYF